MGMARAMVIRRDKRRLILDRKCAEVMRGMSYICRLLRTWRGQRELVPVGSGTAVAGWRNTSTKWAIFIEHLMDHVLLIKH